MCAEAAHCRRPQPRRIDQPETRPRRHGVAGPGIAQCPPADALRRLRGHRHRRGPVAIDLGEQRPGWSGAGPPDVGRADDVDFDVPWKAVLADARPDRGLAGRCQWRSGEFVVPRPAHPDGAARPVTSHERRLGCDIVGAVVPVAACALGMLDRDGRGIDPEKGGKGPAQGIGTLRLAGHMQAPLSGPPRQSGDATDRSVHQVGPPIGGRDDLAGRVGPVVLTGGDGRAGQASQDLQAQGIGCQARVACPAKPRGKPPVPACQGEGVGIDEGDEAPFDDQSLAVAGVERVEERLGSEGRRAQHAGVQHVLRPDVLDEGATPELRRKVDARDRGPAGFGQRDRRWIHGELQADGSGERPQCRAGRNARPIHLPVLEPDLVLADAQPLREVVPEDLEAGRAGGFERQARPDDAGAARRVALVRRPAGSTRHDLDAPGVDGERDRHELDQGGQDPLPDLDPAGAHQDGSLPRQVDPVGEQRRGIQGRERHWRPTDRIASRIRW